MNNINEFKLNFDKVVRFVKGINFAEFAGMFLEMNEFNYIDDGLGDIKWKQFNDDFYAFYTDLNENEQKVFLKTVFNKYGYETTEE